jgi:CRP-like cAMP-binding protein
MLNRKHAELDRNRPSDAVGLNDRLAPGPGSAKLVVGKGNVLFHARAAAPSIYEVQDGALMVYRLIADGRRQIVDVALPGSLCGFSRDNCHECSCEALVTSTVIAHDRAVLKGSGPISMRLHQKMEEQICTLAEHVVLLGRQTTEERLVAFLVRCAEVWRAAGNENAGVFHIPMTRVEIGDYLGMSLETVSRGIADLERRGLITTGARQGEMKAHDLAALRLAGRAQRKRGKRSG